MRRESGPRWFLALAVSCATLAYAVGVIVVAAGAADKGFVAFTGRRVMEVAAGSDAARAGVRVGDRLVAVDGRALRSTADYVDRVLRRAPGDRLELVLQRPSGARVEARVALARAPTPWPAIAATALAALLLALGLAARRGRPGEVAARRFWRATVVYAIVYTGALSWSQLLVHPALAVVFVAALFFAAPVSMDYALVFPSPLGRGDRWLRTAAWAIAGALLLGVAVSAWIAVRDFRAELATDRGLRWVVRFVVALLCYVTAIAGAGLVVQVRRTRRATGAARAQLRWVLLGFVLSALPTFLALPVAAWDIERFLLYRYQPFVIAVAALWFASNSLAVLRVRLAEVGTVIHRSAVYGLASGAAIAVYAGVVFVVGLIAQRVGGGELVPHLVAAVAAAALFVPLRGRVTAWLDRRFFRDRVHYVAALRELVESAARLREPAALARELGERAAVALRAERCELVLGDTAGVEVGDGGLVIPVRDQGALVLGPRRDGELYTREDRDLLAALANQLAVAIDNARAYGTIAELSRELQRQNDEIRELRDRLEDENQYLRRRLAAADDGDRIVGSARATRELIGQLESAAATSATVLLLGESGTGKGLAARALHASSARAGRPFITVDCGAIPEGVFESELFGHERGAFTGAVRRRRGHLELADGGTLLLDEIGELPVALQPKLLRAIQERRFTRVGGTEEVRVDVRFIAATNRKLEDMVARGAFREDLYFRLRVVEIEVPPLRARKADLPELVAQVLPRLCRRNQRPPLALSDDAMARLRAYGWPGNVRELENVLERAVVLSEGRAIEADDLALPDRPPDAEELVADLDLPPDTPHDQVMEAIEKRRLVAALRAAGGNQSSAARALGMARTTLINKLHRFGLIEKN